MGVKNGCFIWVISSFLLVGGLASQNNTLDSLYAVLDTSKNTLTIADAHTYISQGLTNSNVNHAQLHLDSAKSIFSAESDAWGIATSEYQQGLLNRKKGSFSEALKNYDRYMAYVDTIPDKIQREGSAYYCDFQYGVLYEEMGDYESSLKTFLELLDRDLTGDGIKDQSILHNSIGIVYKNMDKYDEALKHFELSLENHQSTSGLSIGNVYSNMVDLHFANDENKKAHECVNKAIEIFNSQENYWGLADAYLNLSALYLKEKDLDNAEKYALLAKDIYENNDYQERKISYTRLGEIYLKKNKVSGAESYLIKALDLDLKKSYNLDVHLGLVELYKHKGNYKSALNHHEKYISLKDSLAGIETAKEIERLQIHYETATKDKEIISQDLKIQEQENSIVLNEAKSTRNRMLAFGSIAALLFAIYYFRQRQRLKNNEIEALKLGQDLNRLEALIEGEENERFRLAQDLHDGINGDLSVIKYKITTIDKNKLDDQESIEYKSAVNMLDNAIEQVRSISHDLAPPSLQNYNLVEAISQYCLKVSSGSNLKINFQKFGEIVDLSDDRETAVYRIVQELINNSVRHAGASNMLVQLNYHEKTLHVSVQDDGVGYDSSSRRMGLGLKNIQSRTQFLDGELIVESSEKGTLTTLDINFS